MAGVSLCLVQLVVVMVVPPHLHAFVDMIPATPHDFAGPLIFRPSGWWIRRFGHSCDKSYQYIGCRQPWCAWVNEFWVGCQVISF